MLSIFQEQVPLFGVTVTEFCIGAVAIFVAIYLVKLAIK